MYQIILHRYRAWKPRVRVVKGNKHISCYFLENSCHHLNVKKMYYRRCLCQIEPNKWNRAELIQPYWVVVWATWLFSEKNQSEQTKLGDASGSMWLKSQYLRKLQWPKTDWFILWQRGALRDLIKSAWLKKWKFLQILNCRCLNFYTFPLSIVVTQPQVQPFGQDSRLFGHKWSFSLNF